MAGRGEQRFVSLLDFFQTRLPHAHSAILHTMQYCTLTAILQQQCTQCNTAHNAMQYCTVNAILHNAQPMQLCTQCNAILHSHCNITTKCGSTTHLIHFANVVFLSDFWHFTPLIAQDFIPFTQWWNIIFLFHSPRILSLFIRNSILCVIASMRLSLISLIKVRRCLKRLSPPCFFMCLFSLDASEYAYWHQSHLFGFYPLCVFKCILRFEVRRDENSCCIC